MSANPSVQIVGDGPEVAVTFRDPAAGVDAVVCTRRKGTEQEADMWYVIEVEYDCAARLERAGDGWAVDVTASVTRYGQTEAQSVRYVSADGGRTWHVGTM